MEKENDRPLTELDLAGGKSMKDGEFHDYTDSCGCQKYVQKHSVQRA